MLVTGISGPMLSWSNSPSDDKIKAFLIKQQTIDSGGGIVCLL